MSVFTSQPSYIAPPSYSRTKIQPPPYKASAPPHTFETIETSFNPIKSITQFLPNSGASKSTASIPLSTTKSTTSSASTSPVTISEQSPVSPKDRQQPSPSISIPPPTYSPIKTTPKPLTSPPAYRTDYEPKPATGIHPRSDTFITRGHVVPSQSHGSGFNYEMEDWEALREREERRRFDELEVAQKEEVGCCAWWWAFEAIPLPGAAFYLF